MPERIQQLLNRVLEWWNKFTAKQKTLIIAAVAGVVMAIAIILTLLGQPQWVDLINCETTKEASEVVALLEGQNINKEVSDDGLRIKIEKKDLPNAKMLLGANDIQSSAYSIDNVTSGGFSTTEADKQRKYKVYLQNMLANDIIASMDAVKSARVMLDMPENDGTLIAKEEEPSASIILELDGEFDTDHAATLAKAISVGLGCKTPENITIMDTQGNMLYSGDDTYSMTGNASSQLTVKSKYEAVVQNEVRKVLLGTNEFDKIEVTSNLALDFSSLQETDHNYYVEEGQTQGYLSHRDIYNAENTSGVGGVPGTDSNVEDTSYQFQDVSESSSTESEESLDFLPSERITNKDIPPGAIKYAESSISVAAINYKIVREEDVKAQGLLDGITWEEYKANNDIKTKIPEDEDLIAIVAKATGIDSENIKILAYSENVFFDAEGLDVEWTDIAQILIIVVMLVLLAFIVIRSMRTEKEEVQEEELSVETLLQSQPEMELENIGLDEGSETKRQIDKFVEDNPEAAAALLRNWLNEDWA